MSKTHGMELPPGWASCALEDAAELIRGVAFPKEAKGTATDDGIVACLRTTNIQATVEWDDLWWIPAKYVRRAEQMVCLGDILISVANSFDLVGKVALVGVLPTRATLGAFIALIRASEPIDSRFLYYLLASDKVQRAIRSTASTTTNISNVSTTKVQATALTIAPGNEQIRIADKLDELLSDLDAGVAALERVRAKLKHFRAAVLKAAVEGALTADWRDKHPDAEPASDLLARILAERRRRWEKAQLQKFKAAGKAPPKDWREKYEEPAAPENTKLPSLPDGWTVASMDALTCRITSGSRDWQQYYGHGSGTFVMAQNVRPGHLDMSYRQSVSPPVSDSSCERSLVECDDLLVTIVGANTGDVCRVRESLAEHYVCQSVALMRPALQETGSFLETYFNSPGGGQFHFFRYLYGAGRPHLSFDQLKMTPVLLPSLAEQEAIVEAVEDQLSVIDHLESDIEAKLKSAQALRQSILRHAFTGQLVPQDPSDEPASELLKRIAAEREHRTRQSGCAKSLKPPARRGGRKKNAT